MLPSFSQSEYLSIFLLLPRLLLRVTFFTFSFISVVISFGFDRISFLLLWLLMWFSLFILQLWLSSKLSHVKNIFLCNVRIFPFRFPFWLHFLSYILAVKVLHDHMSFQKDFIFSVRLLSDRFLINVDHLFSMLLLTLFCCQTLLCLYASCRINFLMLINLPFDFSKQHRIVCWVVLPADSSIRSIGNMGFRSNIRKYGA